MDNSKNTFSELVKAAYREPVVDKEFEHRVMLEVARHAIFRSRQRSQRGTVALLSGISVAAAACVAAVVAWFPTHIILSIDIGFALDTVVASIRALLP